MLENFRRGEDSAMNSHVPTIQLQQLPICRQSYFILLPSPPFLVEYFKVNPTSYHFTK